QRCRAQIRRVQYVVDAHLRVRRAKRRPVPARVRVDQPGAGEQKADRLSAESLVKVAADHHRPRGRIDQVGERLRLQLPLPGVEAEVRAKDRYRWQAADTAQSKLQR